MALLIFASLSTTVMAGQPDDDPMNDVAANQSSIDWNRASQAAQGARSVADLGAVIARECHVQPWEIILRARGRRAVQIESSTTLDKDRLQCASTVIRGSHFVALK